MSERIHFEDLVPGDVREYGRYEVTREEIVAFASEYDPQPMHLDEEAGKASLLGGLCASGWHCSGRRARTSGPGASNSSASARWRNSRVSWST